MSKQSSTEKQSRCPVCRAANQPAARFCEQCGAVMNAGPGGQSAPAANPLRIVMPIVIVLALVGGMVMLQRQPQQGADAMNQALGGNPHSLPGADGNAGGDVNSMVEQYKARLDKDPLDTAALNELYTIYSSISEADKVTPYTQAAVTAWMKQPADSREAKLIADVAALSMQNGDLLGAAASFEAFSQAEPENFSVMATVGDLHLQLSRVEAPGSEIAGREAKKAETWYQRFLDNATPESHPELYWDVLVNQASAMMAQMPAEGADFSQVLAKLERATTENPDYWLGWHSYGMALKAAGRNDEAITALAAAKQHGSPREAWESEQQLAMLENREPDPGDFDPTDPHSGMDMSGGGFNTPHGMPNPHHQGDEVPENPHNIGTQG
ncbi:hypothetical protein KDL29_03615 [bacterium]|nr:hypothetical protein [bacterium]